MGGFPLPPFCDAFLTRKPGVRPQRAVFSSCLAVWKQMNGLILARRKRHMWSMPCKWSLTLSLLTSLQSSSCRERRRLNKARRIWEELRINWRLLRNRLLTKHLTVLRWNDLYNRLFLNIYEERMKWKEDKCSGPHENTVSFIGPERRASFPPFMRLLLHFQKLDHLDVAAWGWIAQQEHNYVQVWHTKQGVFKRKFLMDVRDDPMRSR